MPSVMQFKLKLREVDESGTVHDVPGFAIDADGHDAAKVVATRRLLVDFGYLIVRAVSFTTDGGMVAYVFAKVAS